MSKAHTPDRLSPCTLYSSTKSPYALDPLPTLRITNTCVQVFTHKKIAIERKKFKQQFTGLFYDCIVVNGIAKEQVHPGNFQFSCDICSSSYSLCTTQKYYHHIIDQSNWCEQCVKKNTTSPFTFSFSSSSTLLFYVLLVLNRVQQDIYNTLNCRKLIALYLTPQIFESRHTKDLFAYTEPYMLDCDLCSKVIQDYTIDPCSGEKIVCIYLSIYLFIYLLNGWNRYGALFACCILNKFLCSSESNIYLFFFFV